MLEQRLGERSEALKRSLNGAGRTETGARLTLIFTLYNAAGEVADLVDMALAQVHPDFERQEDWLRVVFIDDCSGDATPRLLELVLAERANPPHVVVLRNLANLGLSRSLNLVLRSCSTEYVLTCQSDCRFGSNRYAAEMLALLERYPDAAAITGQPASDEPIPFEEKINLVENIQDIFPSRDLPHVLGARELIYIGFAEGRADGFRLEAIEAAGYYDTTLRSSGEDQVLAGRFRELGYNVYQAPGVVYKLSLSSQQDSIHGLLFKQHVWGKTHPYILLRAHETLSGVIGKKAGSNRRLRVLLRTSQVISMAAYVALPALLRLPNPVGAIGLLAGLVLMKGLIFRKHLRRVKMSPGESLAFVALQPIFDLFYTTGLMRGLFSLARGNLKKSI